MFSLCGCQTSEVELGASAAVLSSTSGIHNLVNVAQVLFWIFGFPEEMNSKKDFFTKGDRLYDGRCDGKLSLENSDLISVSLEYCFRLVRLNTVQVQWHIFVKGGP